MSALNPENFDPLIADLIARSPRGSWASTLHSSNRWTRSDLKLIAGVFAAWSLSVTTALIVMTKGVHPC